MRSFQMPALVCVLLVSISACKPDATDNTAAPKTDASVAKVEATKEKSGGIFSDIFSAKPPAAKLDLGEFKLLEVNLGTSVDAENLVTTPKTQFGSKEKIYASVLSSGKHQGLTIQAHWTAPDGSVIASSEQPLVPNGGTVTTFSISNPDAWLPGAYTLDISLNDSVQKTVSFEIK